MSLFNDTDLFTSGKSNRITYDLQDGELILFENFFTKEEADKCYHTLLEQTLWKQEHITIYGKTHLTPRLTSWYGDSGMSYAFSGTRLHPHPWTSELLFIKKRVEEASDASFNSVLLNLYRSGQDSVGWHRDNEKEFGINPVIASVSFGETRPFQLRHKFKKDLPKIEIPLTHGSFLLMKGKTQHFWEHQIPKTAKEISSRINLTFRKILPAE